AGLAKQLEGRGYAVTVCPLVGEGLNYQNMGFPIAFKNPNFPSGGFLRRFADVVTDLRAGLLGHLVTQFRQLKTLWQAADAMIVVGDVFALVLATGFSSRRPVYFLPTAKSDLFMRHSPTERLLMRCLARRVFARDERTASALVQQGLPALYLGNLMWDELSQPITPLDVAAGHKVVLLLPGSRNEAYANAAYLVQLAVQMPALVNGLTWVMAAAPTFSVPRFAAEHVSDWALFEGPHETWTLRHRETSTTLLVTASFAAAVDRADVVIGLAGTANEQAVYAGKTVIAFEGFGPQSTRQRFEEQQNLLGDHLVLVNRDVAQITQATLKALASPLPRPVRKPGLVSAAIADVIDADFRTHRL
ncbi:MAG: hypothetical protein AAB066_03050, partial [Candidatus Margulisiibacteriota bacterium]